MSVTTFEYYKRLKEAFEIAGRIIDILKESEISVRDLYRALPALVALMAMGSGGNTDGAIRFIDLLSNSAKELVKGLFEVIE
ncbi:MAG: hypothetical protein QXI11_02035 [Thermoproteota archaeon]